MTFVARITTLFLGVLISVSAHAQFISEEGRFEVDKIAGCFPLTVNITKSECGVKPDGSTVACDMEFGDGTNGNLTFSHTYTQPGTYRLLIRRGGGNAETAEDQIQIRVLDNTPPQFELYSCAANQVAINITDTNFENYIVNFGDGSPETTFQRDITLRGSHTYPSPGSRNIAVRGINDNALDNCSAANQTINAIATLPIPTITQLDVVDESSIRIAFNGLPNIVYRLEVAPNNAPSFQILKTLYNVTTDIIANIKPDDNFYCYRLGVVNPCTGQIQYSPIICSANVDLTVQNNQNTLNWLTRTSGVSNFRITRTTSGSSLVTSSPSSPYRDTDIFCGQEYCYQVTTLYPNGSLSTSLVKCGTAISNDIPDAIENISSIVNGNAVDLTWQANPSFTAAEYSIQKNVNKVFSSLQTTTSTSFSDPAYSTEVETCFKIYYDDVCGNRSETSAEACSIRLTGSLRNDNSISLSWTEYNGWENGVDRYIVQKFTPEGALLQTFDAGAATTLIDDEDDLLHQVLIYVIIANPSESGVAASVSNRITIIKNPNLFYPRAFTPNSDNLNDVFNVYGQFINEFEMSIFNRWGELMYTTTEISEGWDGTFKGNQMQEGTYTFIVKILDRAGRKIKESGSVLLLRKK